MQRTDVYGFKKRMAIIEQEYVEKLEAEVDRRAIEGIDHPVIYKGSITDTYKEYSDNLLMFRLKKLRPEYRENYLDPNKQQSGTVAATKIVINLAPGVVPPDQPQIIELPVSNVEGEYREISEGDKS